MALKKILGLRCLVKRAPGLLAVMSLLYSSPVKLLFHQKKYIDEIRQ